MGLVWFTRLRVTNAFYLDTIWNRLLKNSHSKPMPIFVKNYYKYHFKYLDELEKSQRLIDNWDFCINPSCLLNKALSEKLAPPHPPFVLTTRTGRRQGNLYLLALGLAEVWEGSFENLKSQFCPHVALEFQQTLSVWLSEFWQNPRCGQMQVKSFLEEPTLNRCFKKVPTDKALPNMLIIQKN